MHDTTTIHLLVINR